MNKILDKVDEIIVKLRNNDNIKKMYILKDKINSSNEIKTLLEDFKNSKDNNINILKTKKKLYKNKMVNEYLSIQNELDYIIMYFNSRITSIISNKACNKDNI